MNVRRSKDILGDLISFQSVSTEPNLDIIEYLRRRLDKIGARTQLVVDESGSKANLFATLGPDEPGGILLSGHTDVVPTTDQEWSTDPFQMSEREGLLYGRGACDMKGFIACVMAMSETLEGRSLVRPLHFAFTHDEETGCLGAQALIAALQDQRIVPEIAIVGEPTEMRIIEGHKGCYEYTTRFRGLEGHGSAPDAGVNAAEQAVRYVGKLLELRDLLKARCPDDSQFEPPWTTINVGRLSGGIAHNVIAGNAEVDWEMRPVKDDDADFVKSALESYANNHLLPEMRSVHALSSISLEIIGEVVGLEPMIENAARDLMVELTGSNTVDLVSFGTEAGLFQSLGTDVVVCGPGSISQAHKPDEYLSIEQLGLCCSVLAKLRQKLTA